MKKSCCMSRGGEVGPGWRGSSGMWDPTRYALGGRVCGRRLGGRVSGKKKCKGEREGSQEVNGE